MITESVQFLFFFCLYFSSIGDSFRLLRPKILTTKYLLFQSHDSFIDITPDKTGGVLKRIIRKGDYKMGSPKEFDIVDIAWKFFFLNGTLFHDSSDPSYRFRIPHVVNFSDFSIMSPGITIGVQTMNKGETSSFILAPKYGLGVEGSPPEAPPNLTFRADVTLVDFERSDILPYDPNPDADEFDRKSLVESLYAKRLAPRVSDIPPSRRNHTETSSKEQSLSEGDGLRSPSPNKYDAIPPSNSRRGTGATNNAASSKDDVELFDPNKHRLHPDRRIQGRGRGFSWDETPETIDVEIPLEKYQLDIDGEAKFVSKQDLDIRIKSNGFSVFFRPLNAMILEGPLYGKINPSQSSWNLDDDDPSSDYRGQRLILNLEKGYGHQELWASVFEKDYVDTLQG